METATYSTTLVKKLPVPLQLPDVLQLAVSGGVALFPTIEGCAVSSMKWTTSSIEQEYGNGILKNFSTGKSNGKSIGNIVL